MVTDNKCAAWCDDHDISLDECVHEIGSFVLDDGAPFRGELVRAGMDHPVMVQVRQFVDRPQPLVEIQLADTSGLMDTDWLTPAEADQLGRLLIRAALEARPCPFYWCPGCEWEADSVGGTLSRHHNRFWPSGVDVGCVEFPDGRWERPQVRIPLPPDGNTDEVTDGDWLFAVSAHLVGATAALRDALEKIDRAGSAEVGR